jgi:hypothetical protein
MTDRLTEAELAELDAKFKRLLGRFVTTSDSQQSSDLAGVLSSVTRLIAAARLANAQAELLELTELRVTMMEGEFAAARGECGGDERPLHHVIHEQLTERDTTIARLTKERDAARNAWSEYDREGLYVAACDERGAACAALEKAYEVHQRYRAGVVEEFAEQENVLADRDATIEELTARIAELEVKLRMKTNASELLATIEDALVGGTAERNEKQLADRDATIERLTKELANERNDRRRDIDAMRDAEDRLVVCLRERDAARAALTNAKATIAEFLHVYNGADGGDTDEAINDAIDALAAELDK